MLGTPIGTSSFRDIRENNMYYVDKSLFLEKILGKGARVSLITRPRRFGKTLMLNMVNAFLTPQDAETNRRLFHGLAIEKNPLLMEEYQGKVPVIFLSFKDFQADTFQEFKERIAIKMCDTANSLPILAEASKGSIIWQRIYNSILEEKLSAPRLETALASIMEMLSHHYNKCTAVLVDEYDNPFNGTTDMEDEERKQMLSFFGRFLGNALKDNKNLAFSVITGIHRITKENIFSGLNNIYISNVQNGVYAEDFGFTGAEVEEMMVAFGMKDKMEKVKEWYDGYRFGEYDIYNPWSVMNFLENMGREDTYWRNTSQNTIVKEYLSATDSMDSLTDLFKGNGVEAELDDGFAIQEADSMDRMLSLMVSTGYLKPVKRLEGRNYIVEIPNKEVHSIFKDEILDWCMPKEKRIYERFLKAIQSGKEKEAETILEDILTGMISYHDAASEAFYHGMMLGLLASGNELYEVTSNREAGNGRYDICMIPRKRYAKKLPGILMELKRSKTKSALERDAEVAIGQIGKNNYFNAFQGMNIKEEWWYGISFMAKEVHVKAERVLR